MPSRARKLDKETLGKALLWVVIVGGIAMGIRAVKNSLGGDDAAKAANTRIFIDSETLKSFNVTITPTTSYPVVSPFTGKETGYPAELCYWTKDGTIKDDPTPVLLNSLIHPGSREPTFCPDCGRLVVGHNPKPRPGDRPPPTREEYFASGHADLR
jgi:hypothetical protein